MSTQETKLKAIADAIREKEGSAEPIPASDFPDRIRAISSMPEGMHEISVTSSDDSMGAVAGGGMASEGMTVTVSATPLNGNKFEAWKEAGSVVSENREYAFDVDRDRELEAAFAEFKLVWGPATLPSSETWNDVAYGNGKFVVVAGGNLVAYSSDAKSWTKVTGISAVTSTLWHRIAYGNGRFAVIPYSGNRAAYSTDGAEWREAFLPSSQAWNSIAYGSGKFIAIGSKMGAYSTDGANWTEFALPSMAAWQSVVYGGGKFVLLPVTNTKAAYSADGINWTESVLPTRATWARAAFGDIGFIALKGTSSSDAIYSADGIHWKKISLPSYAYWCQIAYGDGKFVIALGTSNTTSDSAISNKSAYSADGINWTTANLPSTLRWNGLAYGDGKFVAVAYKSTGAAYALA